MEMNVKVVIPKYLIPRFSGRSELDLEAPDLKVALDILARDYNVADILLTREGNLQSFIRVTVDEHLVMSRKAEDLRQVPVAGRTVEIQTPFAGG
jgi:hypothetical protein